MGYKMKGFSGYGNSPAKQDKKSKKKDGPMQGPIPEQNIEHQYGEDDVWIYGRGYKGDDPKEGVKRMKETEKRFNEKGKKKGQGDKTGTDFVKRERIIDYDERAGFITQNDLPDLEGINTPEANEKRRKLKETVKTLDREAQIMRDRKE